MGRERTRGRARYALWSDESPDPRGHRSRLLQAALEPWFEALTKLHRQQGMPPARARAYAHQGVAVTRGLLLDLIATEHRRDVDRVAGLSALAFAVPVRVPQP